MITTKSKRQSFKMLVWVWVGMWCINFMGKGTRIALFGGLLLFITMTTKVKRVPRSFVLISFEIIMFGIIYTTLINYYEDLSILRGYRDMFLPIILYFIGFLSIDVTNKKIEDNLIYFKALFTCMAVTLFIYASANLFFQLFNYGEISYYNRRMFDIWTRDLTAATTQGSRYILMSALLPVIIFSKRSYKLIWKVILLVCVLITIISTLIMANRTLLIILLINFIVCLFLFMKLGGYKKTIILKIFIIINLVFALFALIYIYDLFGLQTFYKQSNFYLRMEVMDNTNLVNNVRIDAWKTTLIGLFYYPMGGSKAPISLSAPHNLWLDVAYTTGLIPFVLLICITTSFINYYLKLIKSHQIDNDFKIFLTSATVSLILNCMVEPILGGHYILFMIFMFQLGLMQGLVYAKKEV